MHRKSSRKRKSVIVVEMLVGVVVLAGSVPMLCEEWCRDRMLHVMFDAACGAMLSAGSQLLTVLRNPSRGWGAARLLTVHELRNTMGGAYFYSLVLTVIRYLIG